MSYIYILKLTFDFHKGARFKLSVLPHQHQLASAAATRPCTSTCVSHFIYPLNP